MKYNPVLSTAGVFCLIAISHAYAQWLPRFDDTDFCRPAVIADPTVLCCQHTIYSDPAVKYGCCGRTVCDLYTGGPVDTSKLTQVNTNQVVSLPSRPAEVIHAPQLAMITKFDGVRQQPIYRPNFQQSQQIIFAQSAPAPPPQLNIIQSPFMPIYGGNPRGFFNSPNIIFV